MKASRTDTLTSQQAPIELYSEDSCSWMVTDSPQDESPFPMVFEDQKMRYVYDDYVEGGALRSGSMPKLFSRKYFGLVAQYAGVGFIDGVLPNVIYPFLQNYLNLPGSQTTTAFVLVQMPWSFKVFYGIISDCFPIWGYRRRPYILGGWIFALIMLLILSFTPEGKPYFTNPEYRDVKPEDYTPEIIATINYDAANDGSLYIIPMMGCAFGYLLSDVCADGIVVELAQREPYEVRGNTQTVIYTTRTVFNMLAYILLGFCFNGEEYGGDFNFSLSFPMLMLIVTIVLAPIVPVTWFFLHEEKNAFAMNFNHYMHTLWDVIKTRAVYQYIAYQFFSGIFASFTYLSKNPIMRNWVGVSPIQEKVGGLLSTAMYATSIYFAGNYGRSWDWRRTAAITMVCYVTLDAFVKLMTIWNIVRSPYFWLGIPILEQMPLGVIFIVSSFIIVELATEGHEGAMYGLLTTVYNLAIPFATAITRNVDSLFNLTNERIQNDTNSVRTDMTMTVLIMWTANLCSLAFLAMLPRQKEQTRAMKQLGGSSYFMGVVTVTYLLFALLWTTTTSLLSIFESTSCLVIAGGNGCDKGPVKP
ncbi:putative folate-biopterin transporter 4 [Phytophthora citrophthora]|uniref:Folate-biopterin transporter 4 n=1 Tax=Phytophthora citrophthora TaxID=4793 RepID=A0AAD9H1R8_9STRA|nr:putative folate-biopterin transporter 4 [Phytophthora citrophthora]